MGRSWSVAVHLRERYHDSEWEQLGIDLGVSCRMGEELSELHGVCSTGSCFLRPLLQQQLLSYCCLEHGLGAHASHGGLRMHRHSCRLAFVCPVLSVFSSAFIAGETLMVPRVVSETPGHWLLPVSGRSNLQRARLLGCRTA